MARSGLPPAARRRARRSFNLFSVFNTFSYFLLTGNILTLFLLRIGTSSTFIGLVASLPYISFFFMLVGRRLVGRLGVVRLFGTAWTLRYLMMLPLVFSTVAITAGNVPLAYAMVLVSVLGFQITRGVGLVANSPLLGELSAGRDRGGFLARFQMITAVTSIVAGLSVAGLLGGDPPVSRYSLLMAAGVSLGLFGSWLITRLPEPSGVSEGAAEGILGAARNALAEPNFRRLIASFAVLAALSGAARTFLVVYARQVYLQPDSTTMLFTVIGSSGWVVMGFVARHVIDRLGAKPMLITYSCIYLFSLVPAIVSPAFSGTTLLLHLGLVFFLATMGYTGGEYCAQTYFFSLISPKDRLNLGIVFFMTLGVGGSIGSLLGGVILDALAGIGIESVTARFRLLFGLLAAVALLCIRLMIRLERLGATSTLSALSAMLSLRDMRTITLLNRLDRTTTIAGQQRVIQEIAGSSSQLALSDILPMLKSPSFAVRNEALEALVHLPVDKRVTAAVLQEIREHEFTTAYIAARVAGTKGISEARPILRAALRSPDYLLVAKSMVALARLGDSQAIPEIERQLERSENPLVVIHAATALKLLGSTGSIPALIDALHKPDLPHYAADEIILALAALLQIEQWFYPLYSAFLNDPEEAIEQLEDFQNECSSRAVTRAAAARPADGRERSAVAAMIDGDPDALSGAAEALYELERRTGNTAFAAIEELLEDAVIHDNPALRFFVAAAIVRIGCRLEAQD
ncbi:MAG: MFS transporter [Spirochaetaceae bacterium]|nr:MAG: MFS transporter [Spirochaetaceae bacterium]